MTATALGELSVDGIVVTLRRNARARRMTLRVARADGAVTLTLPPRITWAEAAAFAQSRAAWLRRAQAARPAPAQVVPGAVLPVEGRGLLLTPAPIRGAQVLGEALLVAASRPGAAAEGFLKHLARDRLALACDRHGMALGRRPQAIRLRDTRSRWGSCTHDGRLMFSWRLAMAPPQVLDYVAAHEVAHLAHMDHSPSFWATVERLLPGHSAARSWLRQHGAALQAWKFRAD